LAQIAEYLKAGITNIIEDKANNKFKFILLNFIFKHSLNINGIKIEIHVKKNLSTSLSLIKKFNFDNNI
jgi:hypothetical protein